MIMNTNNEETVFLNDYLDELKKTEKKLDVKSVWKPVSIGGVSAIMLGVGAYALGNMGRELFHVDDSKSFDEAFDEAREELGSDGVFQYKDGAYVACSPEEWDDKSDLEKATVVSHLVPEEYLDVDLSSVEHNSQPEQVVSVDVNEHVNPINVEEHSTNQESPKVEVNVVADHIDDPVQVVETEVESTPESDVVIVAEGESEDQPLTDEIEVTLVDDASVEEGNGVVGKIIEEIAELIVPESSTSHPAPLEASKAVDIDENSSDNPEVAPDMPDYMQDADMSSIF